LTPQELTIAGEALYGPGWRRELARAFGASEVYLHSVESGCSPAPTHWRAVLVGLAQDMALRALETASNLLSREESDVTVSEPRYAAPARYV